ncbi:MAG: hypothetical protein HDR83_00555 [Bacteroides sp.]|nr:hypothetical protein [Bacteroides sp.]
MRSLILPLIMLVALSAFWSCGHRGYDSRLLIAESIIIDRPDSSLAILDSLSLSDLHRESDRALYAMLVTQALEKLHLKPTDDSLIAIATDYYDCHDDAERQAISHYYRGIVQYNTKNFPIAIVYFFRARDIAKENHLDFWAGMSCRGIADIYNSTYNAAEELIFSGEELEHMTKSGVQPYLNYSLLDYAQSLGNMCKWDESNDLLKQVLDSAELYQDYYLRYCSMQNTIHNLILTKRFSDVSPIMLSCIMDGRFSEAGDTCLYCHVMIESGCLNDSVVMMVENLSDGDIIYKKYLKYKIAEACRDVNGVVEGSEDVYNSLVSEFRECMSHTLTTSISAYYDLKAKHSEAELEIAELKMYFVLIICVVVISIIIISALYIVRRQKISVEEKVLLAEQLQEDLNKSRESNSASLDIIRKVMSEKYELLDNIGTIVLYTSDTRAARRKIADAVTGIINDLTIGSGKIAQFEDEVNRNYDGLFDDFKNDLPNLKEADYRLFLFSVLGLSNSVISLFLKEDKIEAIYNRRRRLKNKISDLDETKKERYLKFL